MVRGVINVPKTAVPSLRRATEWAVAKFDVRKKKTVQGIVHVITPEYCRLLFPVEQRRLAFVCFVSAYHEDRTPRITSLSLKIAALVGGKVKTVGPCICQRHALKEDNEKKNESLEYAKASG